MINLLAQCTCSKCDRIETKNLGTKPLFGNITTQEALPSGWTEEIGAVYCWACSMKQRKQNNFSSQQTMPKTNEQSKKKPKIIRAKFSGTCLFCGEVFQAGEKVFWYPKDDFLENSGSVHQECHKEFLRNKLVP